MYTRLRSQHSVSMQRMIAPAQQRVANRRFSRPRKAFNKEIRHSHCVFVVLGRGVEQKIVQHHAAQNERRIAHGSGLDECGPIWRLTLKPMLQGRYWVAVARIRSRIRCLWVSPDIWLTLNRRKDALDWVALNTLPGARTTPCFKASRASKAASMPSGS